MVLLDETGGQRGEGGLDCLLLGLKRRGDGEEGQAGAVQVEEARSFRRSDAEGLALAVAGSASSATRTSDTSTAAAAGDASVLVLVGRGIGVEKLFILGVGLLVDQGVVAGEKDGQVFGQEPEREKRRKEEQQKEKGTEE